MSDENGPVTPGTATAVATRRGRALDFGATASTAVAPAATEPEEPKPRGRLLPTLWRRDRDDTQGRHKRPRTGSSSAKLLREQRRLGRYYAGGTKLWRIPMAVAAIAAATLVYDTAALQSRTTAADVNAIFDQRQAETGREFPSGAAIMWAGQVVRTWGTWSEADPDRRRVALAPFLTSGMDEQAGWSGRGTQTVTYDSINPEPQVINNNRAMIEAAYQIQDGSWHCVALPVFTYRSTADSPAAFALSGNPTPIGCAPRTGAPRQQNDGAPAGTSWTEQKDPTLASFLSGFFVAWAASDSATLTQYLESGVTSTGLGGAMASTPAPTITGIALPLGGQENVTNGTTYTTRVTVQWTVANSTAQVTATYLVPMRRDDGVWRVTGEPRALPQGSEASGSGVPAKLPDPVAIPTPATPTPATPTAAAATRPATPKPPSTR